MHQTAEAVVRTARSSGATICVAESCTGGLLATLITEVPGASRVFPGGVVAYSNQVKVDLLGVDETLLDGHGAVSPEVAQAMAHGSLCVFTSDVSLSITGIAGPSGGSQDRPVGSVWFGVAIRTKDSIDSYTDFRHFDGNRESVRKDAALHGLRLLLEAIKSIEGA